MKKEINIHLKQLDQLLAQLSSGDVPQDNPSALIQSADNLLLDLMFGYVDLDLTNPQHPDLEYAFTLGQQATEWYNQLYEQQFSATSCSKIQESLLVNVFA